MINRKNFLIPFLVIVAIVLWSHNIYRIFTGINRPDQGDLGGVASEWTEDDNDTCSLVSADESFFVYEARYRDPFQHWLTKPKKRSNTASLSRLRHQDPPLPQLRLSGILRDSLGVLAIIEGPLGDVYFVKEGEQIGKVKIIAIDSSTVSILFGNKKHRLQLEP